MLLTHGSREAANDAAVDGEDLLDAGGDGLLHPLLERLIVMLQIISPNTWRKSGRRRGRRP